jgi:hypothetical protein
LSGFRGLKTWGRLSLLRLLERRRVLFVSAAVLVMSLALLAVSFATAERGQTVFGPPLGADYAGFYAAAMLLNTTPPDRLYDFTLQDAIYHEVLPDDPGHLPYLHPPFVALTLRPLARLPYAWSFGAWLVVSAGLYLAGLILTLKRLRFAPADRPLILLLALSFEPFIMECWMGGQLSAVGFFCVALAYYWLETGRPTAAGAALGLCLYKPTLLVLLLPMLVLARRWRPLAGFALAGLGLAGVSVAAVGWRACLDYAGLLLGFARTTGGSGGAVLPASKYVDLNSFFRMLCGGPSPFTRALMLLTLAVPLGCLAVGWWRVGRGGGPCRRVLWAATLTWTLVANLYVGAYDSILVVLAALLTADALYQPGEGAAPFRSPTLPAFLLLLYLVPWVSQHLARATGLQLSTLILLAFGAYQLTVARAIGAARPTPDGTGPGGQCEGPIRPPAAHGETPRHGC